MQINTNLEVIWKWSNIRTCYPWWNNIQNRETCNSFCIISEIKNWSH